MSNKKTVSVNVFHILKSVMDAKAKKLNDTIRAGADAEHEHKLMRDHIAHLQNYASQNSRFDPSEAQDAEELIESYEYQMKGIGKKIQSAAAARAQMPHVNQFNQTYNQVCRMASAQKAIRKLMAERQQLGSKLDAIADKMDMYSIQIECCTDSVFAEDYKSTLRKYSEQYDTLAKQLIQIEAEIKSYQR